MRILISFVRFSIGSAEKNSHHCEKVLHVAGQKGGTSASAEYVIQDIFRFLAHWLATLGRSTAASGNGLRTGRRFPGRCQKILNREAIGPRQSRFSIGSAPLTSITKSDAQISGGETRQDLKIPGVSPWWLPRALSCSCRSVYRCHSAVMAAFVSFHA